LRFINLFCIIPYDFVFEYNIGPILIECFAKRQVHLGQYTWRLANRRGDDDEEDKKFLAILINNNYYNKSTNYLRNAFKIFEGS